MLDLVVKETEKRMRIALSWAKRGFYADEIPVGAALFYQGELIAAAHNQVEKDHYALAHAEMLVIEKGCAFLKQKHLLGCVLFSTLQPCPMCASAIALSRVDTVYYGAHDPEHMHFVARILSQTELISGFLEKESSLLLEAFFEKKRV